MGISTVPSRSPQAQGCVVDQVVQPCVFAAHSECGLCKNVNIEIARHEMFDTMYGY